jgi:hypothetical protein
MRSVKDTSSPAMAFRHAKPLTTQALQHKGSEELFFVVAYELSR